MNINKMLSEKSMVTPKGTAYWAKVNTVYDDYNEKPNYQILVKFDTDAEAKMKKLCDDLIAKAKALPEFDGKKWRNEPYVPYHEDKDGKLLFKFKTSAFFKNRETGEDVRKYIPVVDVKKRQRLGNDVAIGNGSTVRVSFFPGVYWSASSSNGINFYLNKIAVDDLVEFGGAGDDFSEFGVTLNDDMSDFETDEEVPI